MSTGSFKIEAQFVAPGDSDPQPTPSPKSRPRGKYKPRLSASMLEAMSEAMKRSVQARKLMRGILKWVESERETTEKEIAALIEAAPITAAANGMYQDKLARLGKLDHLIARLALVVGELESGLTDATRKADGADLSALPAMNGQLGAPNGSGGA